MHENAEQPGDRFTAGPIDGIVCSRLFPGLLNTVRCIPDAGYLGGDIPYIFGNGSAVTATEVISGNKRI
ncbi:hypothetical protein D3C87_1900220 [compost metagenome]